MDKLEHTSPLAVTQVANATAEELFRQEQVLFSLSFARERNITDAIIHYHLQQVTKEWWRIRNGGARQWVINHSIGRIMFELSCFNSRSTVQSSLERMAADKVIGKENSGQLLGYAAEKNSFATATDKEGAYCVLNTELPAKEDLFSIGCDDAKAYGMLKACLLSVEDNQPGEWKKLSASELAKELPYRREEIQKALKEMLGEGLLERNAKKPKLYKRGTGKPMDDIP